MKVSYRRAFGLVFIILNLVSWPLGAQVINEWVADHTGDDTHEYVEVFGSPGTDYSNLTVLQIEGDISTSTGTIGYIDKVYPVGVTDAAGFWFTDFLYNEIENGSKTFLLVDDFTGLEGDDVDLSNDGVIDTTFWAALLDDVSISDLDAGDGLYSAVVLDSSMDASTYIPGGASRIPNGTDTDVVGDWMRNDYMGCGLPGFSGFLEPYEACNTPGTENSTEEPPPPPPTLNEWVADHAGALDDHEFVEIVGQSNSDYSHACVAVIIGDAGSAGYVDAAFQVGATDGSGYWANDFVTAELEDGSFTLLLAEWDSCATAVGTDLDTNDDGAFDVTPWTQIYDSVAVSDGGASDVAYSSTVLGPAFDGLTGPPGGASRVPDGTDTDTVNDWKRNDFDGAGFAAMSGTLMSGESFNTPGWLNRIGRSDYYSNVDYTSGVDLGVTLHLTVDDHKRFDYTDSDTDTWDILEPAQEDPNNSAKILDTYKNASYVKQTGGNSFYDREHSWPKSYGFPDLEPGNYPYTDCHQLFLAYSAYNSDRSNHPYRYCVGCTERATEENNGTGGSPGTGYPGFSNWDTGAYTDGSWETWIGRRGDVARAQFYLDVRYDGGTHGVSGYAEPDLVLTDTQALISASNTGNNEALAYMGMLSDLLAWHLEDPVDDDERRRNDVVYSYQGNRNPFIDHPEWVECTFLGTNCPLFVSDFESGDASAWSGHLP